MNNIKERRRNTEKGRATAHSDIAAKARLYRSCSDGRTMPQMGADMGVVKMVNPLADDGEDSPTAADRELDEPLTTIKPAQGGEQSQEGGGGNLATEGRCRRYSHSHAALYIPSAILHIKRTRRRLTYFNVYG